MFVKLPIATETEPVLIVLRYVLWPVQGVQITWCYWTLENIKRSLTVLSLQQGKEQHLIQNGRLESRNLKLLCECLTIW